MVLIDHQLRPLETVASELDVQTVHGNGNSPAVLEKAGVGKADLVAAVTDRDEVNLLAATFAHAAGATHTAVRVADDALTAERHIQYLYRLGIDLIINEQDEFTREVLSDLTMGGAKELVRMAEGRIHAAGVNVPSASPLLAGPLKEFPQPDVLNSVRLIAVMRNEKLLMPHGDMRFEINDTVYCVGPPDDVRTFLNVIRPGQSEAHKVVIAGGGKQGLSLARHLDNTDKKITVIEENDERAQICSASLKKSMVISGSALDRAVLEEIGVTPETAIVACTGNDENNIIACLLARKLGAPLGIALISNPQYVPIINEAQLLDRAVSPYLTTMNAVLRFVRGASVLATTLLQNVPGELLEIQVPSDSKLVGKSLHQISLPRRAVVAAIARGASCGIATGDTVLREGDQLIVFAPLGAAARLESVFRK